MINKFNVDNNSHKAKLIFVLWLLIGGIKIRLKISIFYGEKDVHLADF